MFNIIDAKALIVPLQPHVKLTKLTAQKMMIVNYMRCVPYASARGSLLYTMVTTKPDITHVVRLVSESMANPSKMHYDFGLSIYEVIERDK